MAKCRACNAEYTETKNVRGVWNDLCGYCSQASRNEAVNVHSDLEYRLAFRASEEPYEQRWAEALGEHQFSSGLGLRLSQEAVEEHLRQRADKVFWEAVDHGADFLEAKEAALGNNKYRGDQRGLGVEDYLVDS